MGRQGRRSWKPWGWAGSGGHGGSLSASPACLLASVLSSGAAPTPESQTPLQRGGASETWEPPLPTTPTVLESEEQMPLLAKQLMKQTACFRAFFFEADFVVGVARCVYR